MDYDESIRWLWTLPDFERTGEFTERPDVAPMLALLAALGDPHRNRPTLHVAGSKGKGSTSVMAEAILKAAGRSVGTYISPHLHRYDERIRIDGEPCGRERFAAALTAARAAIEEVEPRFAGRQFVAFDALTAAGFVAFRDATCDAQVVEVGLGGTLDSTNVFHAVADAIHVVAITPISLEHTAILGDTIAAIAAQKAGVITPGSIVVVGPMRESALDVVSAVAAERGARVVEVAAVCKRTRKQQSLDGQDFVLQTSRTEYKLHLPLLGAHQMNNATTAIVACEELAERAGFELTASHVRDGLAAVRWPARMEVLRRTAPMFIVDGAHNGDSAQAMAKTLTDDLGVKRATFLFGTLAGKDIASMLRAVASIEGTIVAPDWGYARGASWDEVSSAARNVVSADTIVTRASSLASAVDDALETERRAVVAFGSLAFAARVREYLLGIESDMIRLTAMPG